MTMTATELMGAKAYDAQGHYVGKVREFFVEPADQPASAGRHRSRSQACRADRCRHPSHRAEPDHPGTAADQPA